MLKFAKPATPGCSQPGKLGGLTHTEPLLVNFGLGLASVITPAPLPAVAGNAVSKVTAVTEVLVKPPL